MENLNSSDSDLEQGEEENLNMVPGNHETRLAIYQNGAVPDDEINLLLTQLKGKHNNFSFFSVYSKVL